MSLDSRIRKTEDAGRMNKAMEDRTVTESRVFTDDERVEMFRNQFIQAALPDLPRIPGFHVCWLTTTNPRDPIHGRIRLGYEPIKPEEIHGWHMATLKTGEYAGMVGVNEMLAFKIPESLFQKIMTEFHYDAPNREEGKLQDTLNAIREQANRSGGSVEMGDGFDELQQRSSSRPVFES